MGAHQARARIGTKKKATPTMRSAHNTQQQHQRGGLASVPGSPGMDREQGGPCVSGGRSGGGEWGFPARFVLSLAAATTTTTTGHTTTTTTTH